MPQELLNVAVFQYDLAWENPQANRAKIEEWIDQVKRKTDIVFLPEMFTTGFSMKVEELAETMNGETVEWMKNCAAAHQLALCGSLIIVENGSFYNRLLFVHPSGEVNFYDKRHLFTMGNEGNHFVKGTARQVVEYKGWRICLQICYDLRFPVWSRNRGDYDILVYSANWPQARTDVWDALLKARAIENQAYVVAANRVGVDGNTISYSGNSQLIDAKGHILSSVGDHHKGIVLASFSHSELTRFRTSFPVLNDADSFTVEE